MIIIMKSKENVSIKHETLRLNVEYSMNYIALLMYDFPSIFLVMKLGTAFP